MDQIITENIPLTNIVNNITIHQLEQAMLLERAIRFAEIMHKNEKYVDYYNKTKNQFLTLAKKVDNEIIEAEEF